MKIYGLDFGASHIRLAHSAAKSEALPHIVRNELQGLETPTAVVRSSKRRALPMFKRNAKN